MMDARVLEAKVNHTYGIPVIDLHGEINGDAKLAIDQAYDEAQASGAATILLNFENVDYINSTGIALIVNLLARARKNGQTLAACALSGHYRKIFEITRLAEFIRLFPDVAAALDEINLQEK